MPSASRADRAARARRLSPAGSRPKKPRSTRSCSPGTCSAGTARGCFADAREPPPAGFRRRYDPLVARRAAREPIAYITGHREFWGLDFEVTPDVLIPRPETELIVEEAIALSATGSRGLIIDVGTGSGCLAIALALEFPDAELIATDVSARGADGRATQRRSARRRPSHRVRADGPDAAVFRDRPDRLEPALRAARGRASLSPEVRGYEPRRAVRRAGRSRGVSAAACRKRVARDSRRGRA